MVTSPPVNGTDAQQHVAVKIKGGATGTTKMLPYSPLTSQQEQRLLATVANLIQPRKGILAADETNEDMAPRLRSIGLTNSPENRRRYRQMIFASPSFSKYISGVILYDETYRQESDKGDRLVDVLRRQSVEVGIQVDRGLVPLDGALHEGETTTAGMDGLAARVAEYRDGGCTFAKWRCAFHVGADAPSQLALNENATLLARYAAICQRNGLVPIVEPDVVCEGSHSIAQYQRACETVLACTYRALTEHNVLIEGTLLKTNMVSAGLDVELPAEPEEVAEATLKTMLRTVPPAVPAIAFLSGGHSELTSTAYLNAINELANRQLGTRKPWQMTFCYGRALQNSAVEVWRGNKENISAAQKAFIHRARANTDAEAGEYEGEKAVSAATGTHFVRSPQAYY